MEYLTGSSRRGGYVVVRFPSALSMENAFLIEREIESLLGPGETRVAVDLADTNNIYSSGIGMLIRLQKKLSAKGGGLCLVNVSGRLRTILEAMNLHNVMALYATDVEFDLAEGSLPAGSEGTAVFSCVAQLEEGVCRVRLAGRMGAIQDLSGLREVLRGHSGGKFILDLTGVELIDSFGARILTEVVAELRKNGARCVAYGGNEGLVELLHLLTLDELLPVYPNEQEAFKAVR